MILKAVLFAVGIFEICGMNVPINGIADKGSLALDYPAYPEFKTYQRSIISFVVLEANSSLSLQLTTVCIL
jgi:hypothetical protein